MSARYVLTTPARNDIREIVFQVDDRFGRAVADRVYGSIHDTLGRLAEHPEMGRARPDRWPERYRFLPHGPSLIALPGGCSAHSDHPDREGVAGLVEDRAVGVGWGVRA